MKNVKKKIALVNQSIEDVKFLKNNKIETFGLRKVLSFWLILYSSVMAICFLIDYLNMKFTLYEFIPNIFNIMNIVKIIMNLLIIIWLYNYINKINISLQERRILKIWFIFQLLLCISHILPILTFYVNIDTTLAFYHTLPLDLIIHYFSLIYIYSHYRNRYLKILLIIYMVYIAVYYCLINYFFSLTQPVGIVISLYNIFSMLELYNILELVSTYIVIYIFEGERI